MGNLEKYQKKLQQWQNKELAKTENSIRLFYRQLVRDVLADVGDIYSKYEQADGKLTYTEMVKFNRLQKFLDTLNEHINTMSKTSRKSIESLLKDSYAYSYYWMGYAIENSTAAAVGYAALTVDIIERAMNNPVRGLTLSQTLEKNRREIIYRIQQNVTRGLVNGNTYKTMALELKTDLANDYKKAIRIVRTEAHRVNEQAAFDSMKRAAEKGVRSTKTWRSSQDERVRKTSKANHRKLDGQKVGIDEEFNLGRGQRGIAPGNTGYAHHDINCRCFLTYDVEAVESRTNDELTQLTFDDWKKTLK